MLSLNLITPQQQDRIHEKSLELLEKTGITFNYQPALDLLAKHGARIEGRTAFLPADLVTRCLQSCPSSFVLNARDKSRDVTFGGREGFIVLPNLGPVFIQEADGKRRRGVMNDYINLTRLSQASGLVDVVGSCPIDADDVESDTKFLHMLYQSFKHSDKPVMCCTAPPEVMDRQLKLMEIGFQNESIFKEKVVTGTSLSPLSPLAYSDDACHALMAFGMRGQMVIIAGAPMSGISAPVSVSGTSLLINIEFLAGMVLAQCAGPGTPVVYATTASAGNLRNAAYVSGIPETTLLNTFAAQMGHYYKVPTRSVGTATDAKVIDMQAGAEAMQNLLMAGLAGIDAIYETLGTLDSLMSVSYEKFMIDLELLSRVKELLKGVNDTEDQLFADVIEDIGIGGTYLATPSTFEACRDRWSPSASTWWPYDKWVEGGSPRVEEAAAEKCREILAAEPQSFLEEKAEKEMLSFLDMAS